MKDETIIAAISQRDPEVMDHVINQYSRLLWPIAGAVLKNAGSEQDVEECVADTFIYLWEHPDKFNPGRGSLKTLLCILTRSRAIDRYRQITRHSVVPLEEVVLADQFGMQEVLIREETRRELLAQFDGTVVPPADSALAVDKTPEGVVFDETYPMERQYELVGQYRPIIDGYGRIVAGFSSPTGYEHTLTLEALLPTYQGEVGGGVTLPLIYLFTYEASAIREDSYAFICGQLLSFEEMEQYKVYQDEQYAVYEVTDLFYTDLDAYIDYFLTTREDIYFDEQVRRRVHNMYDYYRDKENLGSQFYYNLPK